MGLSLSIVPKSAVGRLSHRWDRSGLSLVSLSHRPPPVSYSLPWSVPICHNASQSMPNEPIAQDACLGISVPHIDGGYKVAAGSYYDKPFTNLQTNDTCQKCAAVLWVHVCIEEVYLMRI